MSETNGALAATRVVPHAFHSNGAGVPGLDAKVNDTQGERAQPSLVHCLTAGEFFAEQPSADLVVPALGICPGPPVGLVGQSFVGKTLVALEAGLSIAIGSDVWGAFPCQKGPWLHLDYEQGRRHTIHRIRRIARAHGLGDDELRALLTDGSIRVAVFPDLRLTTARADEHFKRLFEGVRLVTCDSLRVMLGSVDENSSQVRDLMSSLSRASDTTRAAVLLLHHAGKTSTAGERSGKDQARGSSAIVDEFQSMFVLSRKKHDEAVLVTHEKDRELGAIVEDFCLRIEDVETADGDPKGGLRVVHVGRGPQETPVDRKAIKATTVREAVRECVRQNPGIAGNDEIRKLVHVESAAVRTAVRDLLASGEVVEVKTKGRGNGRHLFLKEMVPPHAEEH